MRRPLNFSYQQLTPTAENVGNAKRFSKSKVAKTQRAQRELTDARKMFIKQLSGTMATAAFREK